MRFAAFTMLAALVGAAWTGQGWAVQREAGAVTGRLHALTVFAHFRDEDPGSTTAPGFASRIFDPQLPGSLTHFYTEMSRGQLLLTGECLPRWYTVSGTASAYTGEQGGYYAFVLDVLKQVDADVDLARFDDDGPDGVPNSGDDDGYVDLLFIVTLTTPSKFIVGDATGIASLGLTHDYTTHDVTRQGTGVRIRSDDHPDGQGGTLQRGQTFEVAVGSMAHEFGHCLGLVDLYDRDAGTEPAEDSAGIGYWGLMGHGALGWGDSGGPNPFCVTDLQQLGWLGVNNEKLRVLDTDRDNVVFEDVNAGGAVYRIPLQGDYEYLLVEHRSRSTSYYERNLPADGLLIWHVNEAVTTNDNEEAKRVDLVCADGLYVDAGYPAGQLRSPAVGLDDLDFWAHDPAYATAHAGNLGDATDVFDGVRFSDYWAASNPAAPAGVSVSRIHRQGADMVADLKLHDRRRAGSTAGTETWSDTVDVVGDIYVAPDAAVRVSPGTVVRVGADALRQGVDSTRVEIIVDGDLAANLSDGAPVHFVSAAPQPQAGDWVGIRVRGLGNLTLIGTTLEDAVTPLAIEHSHAAVLVGVTVRRAASHGMDLRVSAESPVSLADVEVTQAGGAGIRLEGAGLARVTRATLSDNAGAGLECTGNYLDLRDSRLSRNGLAQDGTANLVLGNQTEGMVSGNVLDGGVGVLCAGSGEVAISGNRFVDSRVGLQSVTSRPRITSNVFESNGLALRIEGYAVPARLDLNAVQGTEHLLENASQITVNARNNWWGRDDAEWIGARISGPVAWQPFLNFDPRERIDFALEQNYPNPFNDRTVIRYTVGTHEVIVTGHGRAVVEVRTITGGLVRRLVDETAAPGFYEVAWDGRDADGRLVGSGVYYYELRVGPLVRVRRLLFLK